MARFNRLEVLNALVDIGLVPVFYNPDAEITKKVIQACVAGGVRVFEFTNRGDMAPEVFKEVSRFCASEMPDVILGVGSVVDEPTAAMYIAYGADFVVGPILNEAVALLCNRRKIAYSPGCGSASEISRAEELGVEIVKVFPGSSVGGPGFAKAVLGPCPWTRIMPTGGVDATQESMHSWFQAGVSCVGMGSKLIRKDLVAARDWDGISQNVRDVLGWIGEVRGDSVWLGVDHVGIYPTADASARDIAAWYQDRFGFELNEGRSSFFVSGKGTGRIEIMKEAITDRCHVAIRVSDFEKALESLKARGVDLDTPRLKPGVKAVFLQERDPSGNLVHLLWTGPAGVEGSGPEK